MLARAGSLLSFVTCCGLLAAADLTLPREVVLEEKSTLNLVLAGSGSELTGFQCEVTFSSESLRIEVAAGPAAQAAGKSVFAAVQEPGRIRLIVVGMNSTALRDGIAAVVTVYLQKPPASRTVYPIRMEKAVGTDKGGSSVALGSSDGSVVAKAGEQS